MLLPIIINILLSLGLISSQESYENLNEQERQELIEQNEFVIQDEISMM